MESFSRLGKARVVVANCNAISHMAAVVGTPVVGLYGPTNPLITGPFSEDLTVVSLNKPCAPCYRRGYLTGCGDPVCMTEIPVEMVYREVCKKLNGNFYETEGNQ